MIFRGKTVKKKILVFFMCAFMSCAFALTPHINKGKLTELTLEQAVKELQLSEQELRKLDKEFFTRIGENFYIGFPRGEELIENESALVFKQTFTETKEYLIRVFIKTKDPMYYERTNIKNDFQKVYYVNASGKVNLIFADYYYGELDIHGESVHNYKLQTNVMPIIKQDKIAGIMIYGIEEYLKEHFDSYEYVSSNDVLNHRAVVFWSDDFSTADLRNRYENNADIYIECSKPLIDKKDTFKYTIQNAFDKNPATSYVEDTDDDLFSIRCIFAKELFFQNHSWVIGKSLSINNISVINGYAANENLYFSNNRVKELIISSYNLENKKKSDNFLKELSKIYTGILKDNNLSFSTIQIPKEKIYSVTFSCTQLYKGKKYNDTCLAEFDLYNKNVGWFFGGVE